MKRKSYLLNLFFPGYLIIKTVFELNIDYIQVVNEKYLKFWQSTFKKDNRKIN